MSKTTTRAGKGSSLTHAEMDDNLEREIVTHASGTLTLTESHNRSLINCTGGGTVDLPDAATALAYDVGDFEVMIYNSGPSAVTVGRATGTDTLNGAAGDFTLLPGLTTSIKLLSSTAYVNNIATAHLQKENLIINGGFPVHQEVDPASANNTYPADQWVLLLSGSTTCTSTRTLFINGQNGVPGEPEYYMRSVVTTGSGASDYGLLAQRIEDVRTLAGQTACISFYAKADAAKDIAVEFYQSFGTGGTPPSANSGIDVQTFSLTTSWQKFYAVVNIDAISPGNVGTTDPGYLAVLFWLDAGSDHNARTNSLGNQSGTFDIAEVELVDGSLPIPARKRSKQEEIADCKRFYWRQTRDVNENTYLCSGYISSGGNAYGVIRFPTTMRAQPSVSVSANIAFNDGSGAATAGSTVFVDPGVDTVTIQGNSSATVGRGCIIYLANTGDYIEANARL
jgi:hypothetical protein